MLLEFQITSPGTSIKLKEAGIRLKSDYAWFYNSVSKKHTLVKSRISFSGQIPLVHAYSITDLGMMIPWGFFQASPVHKLPGGIWVFISKDGKSHHYALEVEARANYLIDLIRSKDVLVDQVNHPEKYNQPVIKGKSK